MAEPFLSEIRIMSFPFAPRGWAYCNGQLLPINQNQGLWQLLGTSFGGDGRNTFGLPDLQSRVPIHAGNGHVVGERGGEVSHTLTVAELPTHTHVAQANAQNAAAADPQGSMLAATNNLYGGVPDTDHATTLLPATVASTGGGQAHPNQQPFMTLNFCIALQGLPPSTT
jgi:microcystin-dependent protein